VLGKRGKKSRSEGKGKGVSLGYEYEYEHEQNNKKEQVASKNHKRRAVSKSTAATN